jgi:hypothetical protein
VFGSSRYLVSVTRLIPAERQWLFDLIADPAQHPVIDGSGSVKAVRPGGPDRLSLGATFSMDMKLGADYRILNTVVEFDEPSLIAWRHFYGHIWRYRFAEAPGEGAAGTLVTEEWDARRVWGRAALALVGFPRRNRAGMTATLERMAELAAARG